MRSSSCGCTLGIGAIVAGFGGRAAPADLDGCPILREIGPSHIFGGQRNPGDYWDFFDVTGDLVIDISDAIDVLGYFGDPGAPNTPGNLRDRDALSGEYFWQTSESNTGIDLTDAINALLSFGDDCSP